MSVTILTGDCRDILKSLPDKSVNMCVTSPPYWGLRDYGHEDQIGLEQTPTIFIANLVEVFAEVRRVLRDDGTLWMNMGDSYTDGGRGADTGSTLHGTRHNQEESRHAKTRQNFKGIGKKNILGMPWRLAFALQEDGWYLRQDIIWHKPNPMPESVTDRCTKAHEYIFLLSKSRDYYYDQNAILEPVSPNTHARLSQNVAAQVGSMRANGGNKTNGPMKAVGRAASVKAKADGEGMVKNNHSFTESVCLQVSERNKRSVWTVPVKGFKGAHFATFPPALIRPCILAGCPVGGVVLDPFGGSGTTGEVAEQEGRNSILIEVNPSYVELARHRTSQKGLFA